MKTGRKPITKAEAIGRVLNRIVMGDGGCWISTYGKTPEGYAVAGFGGKRIGAHRLAYEALVGPIPDGLQLDHLCRNRACVRPDHLEPVTIRENLMRGEGFAAKNARKTHCLRGHELVAYGRRRICRECKRLEAARRRANALV